MLRSPRWSAGGLAASWPDGKPPVTVQMAAASETARTEATVVGGARLTVGTSLACTSGFPSKAVASKGS
jgi:hypothetical protein